jgi:choline kinase
MGEFKVLITTSGIGSRLGDLTKYTNKCLVRVGKKPAISYIIESYPENIEIVITLGYYGEQVREFLNLAYPKRNFKFVDVDKFEGDGSSLGYSILKSKEYLQCPFIFHASDTIVTEKILEPKNNWLAYQEKKDNSQYRTISFNNNKIINEKGNLDSNFVYIGLAGIKDYKIFWDTLESEYLKNTTDTSLSDCHAINNMHVSWDLIKYEKWLDIGNVSELKHSRETIQDKFELLDKVDESIFLFDNFVIKFFYNKKTCLDRVKRCEELSKLTPKLIDYGVNFYKYEYATGELLSKVVNEKIFNDFINWSHKNLWIEYGESESFKKTTENFYFDKTFERINKLFNNSNIIDKAEYINGVLVPSAVDMLKNINKDWLCSSKFYQFHGDFILDNIIYKKNGEFVLLDWRQDFGGDLKNGDIYYDLAKLNHNLLFNHEIVHKELYYVENKDNNIKYDILRSDTLTNCRNNFHSWLVNNGFDLKKVEALTSIIWLNMSPLHEFKMGEFLYYLGRYNLYKSINL